MDAGNRWFQVCEIFFYISERKKERKKERQTDKQTDKLTIFTILTLITSNSKLTTARYLLTFLARILL
jgi:hypothetical protein